MSDTRYLSVETANISLVSMLYSANVAVNQVTYHTLFFAVQTCTSTLYDPVSYTCVATAADCVRSKNVPLADVCIPCHYSCLTCNTGNNPNSCASCPSNVYRTLVPPACPCDNHYADAGVELCQLCSLTMPGCISCSSKTTCLICDIPNNFVDNINGTNPKTCMCATGYTLTTGFCLPYPGCLVAGYYNNLVACQSCDASKNFTMVTSNFSCTCYLGFEIDNSTNNTCIDICPNNITGFGRCDDGNNITGDGCDEFCNI
jgi:hypothetical protein